MGERITFVFVLIVDSRSNIFWLVVTMVRIGHIERFVADTLKSKEFYVKSLGFEPVVAQPGGLEWVRSGEMEILLRPGVALNSADYRSGTALVLYADDLESYVNGLKSSGIEVSNADGDACATFRDPDGYWFQVVEMG